MGHRLVDRSRRSQRTGERVHKNSFRGRAYLLAGRAFGAAILAVKQQHLLDQGIELRPAYRLAWADDAQHLL